MRKKKIAIILQFVSHNRLNLNDADLILLTEGSLFAMLKAVLADIRVHSLPLKGTLALSSRSGMEPVS
jgi:hypothetical protein